MVLPKHPCTVRPESHVRHTHSVSLLCHSLNPWSWVPPGVGLPQLGWRLALLMAACIYIGNALKDLVCAPRPNGMKHGDVHPKLIASDAEAASYALVRFCGGVRILYGYFAWEKCGTACADVLLIGQPSGDVVRLVTLALSKHRTSCSTAHGGLSSSLHCAALTESCLLSLGSGTILFQTFRRSGNVIKSST